MKKKILVGLALALSVSLVGCKKPDGEKDLGKEPIEEVSQEAGSESKFVEDEMGLVYLDTSSGILEKPAMKTVVDKENKIVEFIPSDADGNVGADYYKFDLEKGQMEKYYYVSAMGTGHYYYYELGGNGLVKIEDNDHNDSTEGTKSSGRWDSAVEKIDGEVKELEAYFKDQHGKSIEDFIAE